MSECSVNLNGQIQILPAKVDVRAQSDLWSSLSGDVSVTTVTHVDLTIIIKILDSILVVSSLVKHKTCAVRHIEYAKRLSYYLIEYIVVSSVHTGSDERPYRNDVSSAHMHSLIFSAEGKKPVPLPSHVHADVELHIAFLDRRDLDTGLDTGVGHRAYVCQELVVLERRHRHIILIEHICGQ